MFKKRDKRIKIHCGMNLIFSLGSEINPNGYIWVKDMR